MITILVKNCNQISQEFYDSIVNALQIHQFTCTCGHSACLSIHGYYTRSIKGQDKILKLRIRRVRCSECGCTHAILLSSLVPYSQISLPDQQRICLDYEKNSDVYSICSDKITIDENNVKHVLRNYRRKWREMIRTLKISLSSITNLVLTCFSFYSQQVMQIRRVNNVLFPFTT